MAGALALLATPVLAKTVPLAGAQSHCDLLTSVLPSLFHDQYPSPDLPSVQVGKMLARVEPMADSNRVVVYIGDASKCDGRCAHIEWYIYKDDLSGRSESEELAYIASILSFNASHPLKDGEERKFDYKTDVFSTANILDWNNHIRLSKKIDKVFKLMKSMTKEAYLVNKTSELVNTREAHIVYRRSDYFIITGDIYECMIDGNDLNNRCGSNVYLTTLYEFFSEKHFDALCSDVSRQYQK